MLGLRVVGFGSKRFERSGVVDQRNFDFDRAECAADRQSREKFDGLSARFGTLRCL